MTGWIWAIMMWVMAIPLAFCLVITLQLDEKYKAQDLGREAVYLLAILWPLITLAMLYLVIFGEKKDGNG